MKFDIQTPDLFSSASDKPKSSVVLLSMIMGYVFLATVLALPTRVTSWFDGLPWTGPFETLVICILLPFLIILGNKFLSLRWPVIFLLLLLFLKVAMYINSPGSGWLVKVFPGMTLDEVKQNQWHKGMYEAVTSGKWVKTYATHWNINASGILQAPWINKKQFPVDWFLPHGVAPKNEIEQFDALNPWIQFEGAALLPKESSIVIVAQGTVDGTMEAISRNGEKIVLPVAKNYQEASGLAAQAPKGGGWSINVKLQFKGPDWSFIPVLINIDGTVNSDLGRVVLWQDRTALSISSAAILIYKYLSWVIDIGICLFFIAWGVWTARFLVQELDLSLSLGLFSAFAIILSFLMGPFLDQVFVYLSDLRNIFFSFNVYQVSDINKIYHLGFSIVFVGLGFLFWAYWKNDFRSFQSDRIVATVFLLYGPTILIFFSYKWFPQIGLWSL